MVMTKFTYYETQTTKFRQEINEASPQESNRLAP